MSKYITLLNVLDQLRKEAPSDFKRYYPLDTETEKVNQARAKAFIHLFLKVKFGLLDFTDREMLITDETNDGGIDAYYIDRESKKVYFIQSKFRMSQENFRGKEIDLRSLLNMDVDRIVKGETTSECNIPYNNKIKQLIKALGNISDIGRYNYQVILLANLADTSPAKLRKLSGGFPIEVFNHERTYNELVFPVIKGTYYNPGELKISINLSNKESASAKIDYKVSTSYKDCNITVLFVPTIEVAKTLHKYKNSILKYNPRSYLELANNTVNKDIATTLTELSTNEFALYNNGITMLSYGTHFNEQIGQKDRAQLIITQPQIINGGQTAFTLSRLYEDNLNDNEKLERVFAKKEVLLKIITFQQEGIDDNANHMELVKKISKATNSQTPVNDADRRSNESVQIKLQEALYNTYGYFYECKRGEYADGLWAGYIERSQIIDRDLFLRLCKCCDLLPSEARNASSKRLFNEQHFDNTLNNVSRFEEYFFAFRCHEILDAINKKFSRDKHNKFGLKDYGYALRYGRFAVVSACMLSRQGKEPIEKAEETVNGVLAKWLEFESYISEITSNNIYFSSYVDGSGVKKQEVNIDGYYKGRTLNSDLRTFFKKKG